MSSLRGVGRAAIGLLLVSLAFTSMPANADTREDARTAYAQGDFKRAFSLLLPLAKDGDVSAQNSIGTMYLNGRGVSQNIKEAIKWWRLAGESGDASAQTNLGLTYLRGGEDVPKDYVEARKWFALAASQGNPVAWSNLGAIHAQGLGTPHDLPLAFMWFSIAASNGNDGAIGDREFVDAKMTPAQKLVGANLVQRCKAKSYKHCGD